MKRFSALLIAGILLFPIFALASTLRVQVLSKYRFDSLEVRGESLRIRGFKQGREIDLGALSPAKIAVAGDRVDLEGKGRFERLNLSPGASGLEIKMSDVSEKGPRRFRGELEVRVRAGRLFLVERPELEDYVGAVLSAELPEEFPLEAQKAQTVLARTYAVAERGRHGAEGFDLCDLTHCQVYAGLPSPSSKQEEAVRSTRGKILTYQGKPAAALFHSTCGGHTSPNQRVFGGRPLAYLQGVADGDFCTASPHSRWTAEIPLEQLAVLLEAGGSPPFRGEVTSILPFDREPAGRIFSLELTAGQRREVSAMDFLSWIGKTLGWNELKSNWFEILSKDGLVHFEGRGLGHGVGLCQWGAKGRAEAGANFSAILQAYFPGTRVERQSQ